MDPIERLEFETAALVADHPPRWRNGNKQLVYEIAGPPWSVTGRVTYSRWASVALPPTVDLSEAAPLVVTRDGFFDYVPVLDPEVGIDWHMNFADQHLFVAYAGSLFAQDELQVCEHPALGSLREALVAAGRPALTVEGGQPTPVLILGVERRCLIDTTPNLAEGRPHGLYGNAFARANPDAITAATTRLDPPTITNLIAIAAPGGGYGRYSATEIEWILTTASTGFLAAVHESQRAMGESVRVAVHTGYWGCGAFGGNRVLMALLQVVAARMAGLDRLAFHLGSPGGEAPLAEAMALIADAQGPAATVSTRELIDAIESMGFEWGVSNGT